MLRNRAHLYNTYTLLYTMPGVPSVYYGSEWGVTGAKQGGSDAPLRPCLELGQISGADEALCTHIARLGIIRRSLPALQYGTYEQKLVKNEQFVFERADDGRYVYIALNLSDHPEYVEFRVRTAPLTDLFTGTTFETNDGNLKLELPAFGARILVPPEDCARLAGAAHAAPGTPEPAQPVQAPDAPAARPDQPRAFRPGRYRHFKGNEYEAIGLARHSETLEQLVVYRALYGEGGLWVRPLDMFMEEIERDGKRFARFTYIGE